MMASVPLLGAQRAAGDRCIQIVHTALAQAGGMVAGFYGFDGRHVHQQRALFDGVCRAQFKQHMADDAAVVQHGDDHVCLSNAHGRLWDERWRRTR